MGGRIEVTSTPGTGSRFVVSLARVSAPPEGPRLAAPVSVAVDQAGQAAGTVLYIEDNLANLRLMERLLAHRPLVRLVPAMQGNLGLELAAEHAPSLVLLDLHLPDIDGVEVLHRLRLHPSTRASAIFILTADATPGQRERLLAEGATGYLSKPIQVEDFLGVLDSTMTDEKPQGGAAEVS